MRNLDTAEAISAFREAFRTLEASVTAKRERLPADWLKHGVAKIGLGVGVDEDADSS
jgi:hypothetical protein